MSTEPQTFKSYEELVQHVISEEAARGKDPARALDEFIDQEACFIAQLEKRCKEHVAILTNQGAKAEAIEEKQKQFGLQIGILVQRKVAAEEVRRSRWRP